MTAPAGWAEMAFGGIDTQRLAPGQSPAADSQLAPTPKRQGATGGARVQVEPREQRGAADSTPVVSKEPPFWLLGKHQSQPVPERASVDRC